MTQRTIPNESITVTYAAVVSTTGPFIVPFTFLREEDVIAIVTDALAVETVLVWNTDFTFSQLDAPVGQEGIGFTGGIIDLVAPIGADGNSQIQILRSTIIDRSANFPNTGPFDMAILNDEMNDYAAIMQELAANQAGLLNTTLQLVTDLGNRTNNTLFLTAADDADSISIGASGTTGFMFGGGLVDQFQFGLDLFISEPATLNVVNSVFGGGMSFEADFGSDLATITAIGTSNLHILDFPSIRIRSGIAGDIDLGVGGDNTVSIQTNIMRVNTDSGGFFEIRDDIGNNIRAAIGGNSIGWTPDSVGWQFTLNDGMELRFEEKAAALANVANFGSIWVNNSAPNHLIFTDDDGTDHDLIALAGGVTSGSFTGTLTGCTTSPTATFYWQKIVTTNLITVYLYCNGGLEGVSNSVQCSVTGIPVEITSPNTIARVMGMCLDDSFVSNTPCEFGIPLGAGTMNMEVQATGAGDKTMNGTNFTNSGNKGLGGGWNISYSVFIL